jgi:hypothetical protein
LIIRILPITREQIEQVTAPKPEGLGFKGMPPHPTMLYVAAPQRLCDKSGLPALHPSSSSPDLLERWEFSTNATEADTVFQVQQPLRQL